MSKKKKSDEVQDESPPRHLCDFCEDKGLAAKHFKMMCEEDSDYPQWEAWLCEKCAATIIRRLG